MSADLTPPKSSPVTVVSLPVPAMPDLPAPATLPASLLPPPDQAPALARPGRLRRAARYWPVGFLGCGVVLVAFWFGRPRVGGPDLITAAVVRGDLPVVVTERGELDSTKSVMVRCDVEGEKSKLVDIVPEG